MYHPIDYNFNKEEETVKIKWFDVIVVKNVVERI